MAVCLHHDRLYLAFAMCLNSCHVNMCTNVDYEAESTYDIHEST